MRSRRNAPSATARLLHIIPTGDRPRTSRFPIRPGLFYIPLYLWAAMNQTRVAELNSIKEWLGMTDLPEAYPVYKTENGTDDFPGISEYIASGFVV